MHFRWCNRVDVFKRRLIGVINKMAERSLVLNNVLCFAFSRINKIDTRQLKSILCNFYLVEDIVAAKDALVTAAVSLQIDTLPKLPKRRDGDGRLAREVDDIFSVLTVLDEANCFSKLPIFVADSPDRMPSIHLIEGDLHAVMRRFDKLDAILDSIGSNVNKSVSLVSTAVCKTAAKSGTVINLPHDMAGSGMNERDDILLSTQIVTDAVSGPVTQARTMDYFASTDSVSAEYETDDGGFQMATTRRKRRRMLSRLQEGINHSLEPLHLSSPCLSHDAAEGTASARNTGPTTVRTAQPSTRRPSARGPAATASTNHLAQTYGQGQGQGQGLQRSFSTVLQTGAPRSNLTGKPPNKRTMIGTSATVSPSWKLSAAKPYVGKAVYCIDNVSVSTTANDLRQFVVKNGISVLSCFEVIPRRSQRMKLAGIVPTDRKAFRLCIASEDVNKLLNCELWPVHITVSKWVSKGRPAPGTDGGDRPNQQHVDGVSRIAEASTASTASTSTAATVVGSLLDHWAGLAMDTANQD